MLTTGVVFHDAIYQFLRIFHPAHLFHPTHLFDTLEYVYMSSIMCLLDFLLPEELFFSVDIGKPHVIAAIPMT